MEAREYGNYGIFEKCNRYLSVMVKKIGIEEKKRVGLYGFPFHDMIGKEVRMVNIIHIIQRINGYEDERFSARVLYQHGAFTVDERPYEVEIISHNAAVIRGEDPSVFMELIDIFREYAFHICRFFDETGNLIRQFPSVSLSEIRLSEIQPSQFFIDEEKLNAVGYFIHSGKDAVIPLCHINGQMVSCDGHTRMMAAFLKGSETVLSYEVPSEDYLREFVREAQNRNIHTVADLQILSHETYEKKWIGFCDSFF